ncbi:hypothetical protein K458DRAFT_476651, partial [Lentithecium fluviatile CBS 122367]
MMIVTRSIRLCSKLPYMCHVTVQTAGPGFMLYERTGWWALYFFVLIFIRSAHHSMLNYLASGRASP